MTGSPVLCIRFKFLGIGFRFGGFKIPDFAYKIKILGHKILVFGHTALGVTHRVFALARDSAVLEHDREPHLPQRVDHRVLELQRPLPGFGFRV